MWFLDWGVAPAGAWSVTPPILFNTRKLPARNYLFAQRGRLPATRAELRRRIPEPVRDDWRRWIRGDAWARTPSCGAQLREALALERWAWTPPTARTGRRPRSRAPRTPAASPASIKPLTWRNVEFRPER
ncbi:hypothetical protein JCM4814A_88640 [Streptomyces phaeofaciens JCM 4814]|uniref:Uncharacterized protein n=1 Tax=Streptomyces phaeofaciens TaxID=68254 RepID=A0A918HJ30_9ACTN|nr:hypothetical protein GCM10010226_55060 [Streptomyces phaeofaciens]